MNVGVALLSCRTEALLHHIAMPDGDFASHHGSSAGPAVCEGHNAILLSGYRHPPVPDHSQLLWSLRRLSQARDYGRLYTVSVCNRLNVVDVGAVHKTLEPQQGRQRANS